MLELLLLVAQLLLCVLLFVLRGREQLLIECGLFVELFLQLVELVLKLLLLLLQGAVLRVDSSLSCVRMVRFCSCSLTALSSALVDAALSSEIVLLELCVCKMSDSSTSKNATANKIAMYRRSAAFLASLKGAGGCAGS